jgi:hypothetical protein
LVIIRDGVIMPVKLVHGRSVPTVADDATPPTPTASTTTNPPIPPSAPTAPAGASPPTPLTGNPLENVGVGHCLSSYPASNGGASLYPCNGGANQTWSAYSTGYSCSGSGYSCTGLKNSGDGECLNNEGGYTSNGNPQIMYNCYSSQNETYVELVGSLSPSEVYFCTYASWFCGSDISSYGNSASGAPVLEYTFSSGNANQLWY